MSDIDELKKENEVLSTKMDVITSVLAAKPISGKPAMFLQEFKNLVENDFVKKVKEYAASENSGVVVVCAKLEEELSGLEDEEKAEMLEEYGLTESGLDKLIRASYRLLGLISYLTAGVQEVRAWTIKEGTKAPAAAGKIHSDIERGFIRAEVVGYDDLVECGSEAAAKEKGLYRLEGKEYVMKDGDVVNFRFYV